MLPWAFTAELPGVKPPPIPIAVWMIPLALMISVGLVPLVITTFEFQSTLWFVLGLPALPLMLLSRAALYRAREPRSFWELLGLGLVGGIGCRAGSPGTRAPALTVTPWSAWTVVLSVPPVLPSGIDGPIPMKMAVLERLS